VTLSSPITTKETVSGELDGLLYAASSMQGWRTTMEDADIVGYEIDGSYLFGVFDGHGGREVAKFCEKHVGEELKKNNSKFKTPTTRIN